MANSRTTIIGSASENLDFAPRSPTPLHLVLTRLPTLHINGTPISDIEGLQQAITDQNEDKIKDILRDTLLKDCSNDVKDNAALQNLLQPEQLITNLQYRLLNFIAPKGYNPLSNTGNGKEPNEKYYNLTSTTNGFKVEERVTQYVLSQDEEITDYRDNSSSKGYAYKASAVIDVDLRHCNLDPEQGDIVNPIVTELDTTIEFGDKTLQQTVDPDYKLSQPYTHILAESVDYVAREVCSFDTKKLTQGNGGWARNHDGIKLKGETFLPKDTNDGTPLSEVYKSAFKRQFASLEAKLPNPPTLEGYTNWLNSVNDQLYQTTLDLFDHPKIKQLAEKHPEYAAELAKDFSNLFLLHAFSVVGEKIDDVVIFNIISSTFNQIAELTPEYIGNISRLTPQEIAQKNHEAINRLVLLIDNPSTTEKEKEIKAQLLSGATKISEEPMVGIESTETATEFTRKIQHNNRHDPSISFELSETSKQRIQTALDNYKQSSQSKSDQRKLNKSLIKLLINDLNIGEKEGLDEKQLDSYITRALRVYQSHLTTLGHHQAGIKLGQSFHILRNKDTAEIALTKTLRRNSRAGTIKQMGVDEHLRQLRGLNATYTSDGNTDRESIVGRESISNIDARQSITTLGKNAHTVLNLHAALENYKREHFFQPETINAAIAILSDQTFSPDAKCRLIGAMADERLKAMTHGSLSYLDPRSDRIKAYRALAKLQYANEHNAEYLMAEATYLITGEPQQLSGAAYTLALGERISGLISRGIPVSIPTLNQSKPRFDASGLSLKNGEEVDTDKLIEYCTPSSASKLNQTGSLKNLENSILDIKPSEASVVTTNLEASIYNLFDESKITSTSRLLEKLIERYYDRPNNSSKRCPEGVSRIIRILENPIYDDKTKEKLIRDIAAEKCNNPLFSAGFFSRCTRAPETSKFYHQLKDPSTKIDEAFTATEEGYTPIPNGNQPS